MYWFVTFYLCIPLGVRMKPHLPKPTPPTAKDTQSIMVPKKQAKQPRVLATTTKPSAKKAPKKRIITAQQGRRTLTTV